MLDYFEGGVVRERSGNKAQGFQPLDAFQAADGCVAIAALSAETGRFPWPGRGNDRTGRAPTVPRPEPHHWRN